MSITAYRDFVGKTAQERPDCIIAYTSLQSKVMLAWRVLACLRTGLLPHSYKRAHDFSWEVYQRQPSRFYNPTLTPAQSCSYSESFAMIFYTTFALALLLLTHDVAHALPNLEFGTRSTFKDQFWRFLATYDPTYDDPNGSLYDTACSDGQNGLAKKFPTFDSIPSFPWIGGGPNVTWNSPECGSCWVVVGPDFDLTKAIYYVAVDTVVNNLYSFNMGKTAFEAINGGNSEEQAIEVYAQQESPDVCGM